MHSSRSKIAAALADTTIDARAAQQAMCPLPRLADREPDPATTRVAAVLVLLYDSTAGVHFPLTVRRSDLPAHPGQISLPGGRQEPDEALCDTALRETAEEIGVPPERVCLLGSLTPLYIPVSDFTVHPFVGWHTGRPCFRQQHAEVHRILEAPLSGLRRDAPSPRFAFTRHGRTISAPYFTLAGQRVWGATAMMLAELAARMQHL